MTETQAEYDRERDAHEEDMAERGLDAAAPSTKERRLITIQRGDVDELYVDAGVGHAGPWVGVNDGVLGMGMNRAEAIAVRDALTTWIGELPAVDSVWLDRDKRTHWRVLLLVPGAARPILLQVTCRATSCADREAVSIDDFARRFQAVP